MNNNRIIKIAFIDDHPVLLKGTQNYIDSSLLLKNIPKEVRTFHVCSKPSYKEETTLEGLLDELNFFNPDIAFVDYGLTSIYDGVDVAERLKSYNRKTKTIVYTGYDVMSGGINRTISGQNLNVPDNILSRLIKARNSGIVDKILEKGDTGLDKIILRFLKKFDKPLIPGVIGRGDFAIRIIQDLMHQFRPIFDCGHSMTNEEFLALFELEQGNPYLYAVDGIEDLKNTDFDIDCASKLRGYQVPLVIKNERKKTSLFYPDRRVVFPFERSRLEEIGPKLRKNKPLIPFNNSIPYYMWFMYNECHHEPELLYSPLQPDSSRIRTPVNKKFNDPKYAKLRKNLFRLLTGDHGNVRTIIPESFGFSQDEIKKLRECEEEAMMIAYKSQEVSAKYRKAVFKPQVAIAAFFRSLYHYRMPKTNVTGYLKFEDSEGLHEGFISYPPLVDFHDLSVRPNWDLIDKIFGRELFYTITGPLLDDQRIAFKEMMKGPYKVWHDSMVA